MVFNDTFSYIPAISFIGGGNRSVLRKPPTCRLIEWDSNSQHQW
jgi:hypothetical protein